MQLQTPIQYSKSGYFPIRFYDHLRLGLLPEIQKHEKNIVEEIGDAGLWPIENLPHAVKKLLVDPKIITIALTSFAMLANSYLFYPAQTVENVQWALTFIPEIPFWAAKFATYVITSQTIVSSGLRAYGRFSNVPLMNAFYTQ